VRPPATSADRSAPPVFAVNLAWRCPAEANGSLLSPPVAPSYRWMVNRMPPRMPRGPWSSLRRRAQRGADGRRGTLRAGARAGPTRAAALAVPAALAGKDRPGPRRALVPSRTKTAAGPGRRATRAGRPSNSTTSPTRNCRPRLVSGSPFTRTSPAKISSLASEPVSARSANFRNCPSRMDSSRIGTSTGLRAGTYRSSHGTGRAAAAPFVHGSDCSLPPFSYPRRPAGARTAQTDLTRAPRL
jgi:hypothetical protein